MNVSSLFGASLRARAASSVIIVLACTLLAETIFFFHYRERSARELRQIKAVFGSNGMALGLPEPTIKKLQEQGLKEPGINIVCNLVENTGYILPKEFLGREIGCRFKKNVQILSSRWILADFEAGTVEGKALIEFHVSDEGKISWRIVDVCLDQENRKPHH